MAAEFGPDGNGMLIQCIIKFAGYNGHAAFTWATTTNPLRIFPYQPFNHTLSHHWHNPHRPIILTGVTDRSPFHRLFDSSVNQPNYSGATGRIWHPLANVFCVFLFILRQIAAMPRAKSRKTSSTTLTQRFSRWLFSPMKLCITAIVVIVWLFLPRWTAKLPQLASQPEYQIREQQIQVTPPPRWIPEDIVDKVLARAGFHESMSLLDPRLSEKVALAFHTHPWIERLVTVKKSYPARLQVEVVYRKPVALVEVAGGGYFPIDRLGYLLPNEDFRPADQARYPIVQGVQTAPLGYVGEAWGDPAVTGAAHLAETLTEETAAGASWWDALQLKSIVVPSTIVASDTSDELQYRFKTAGGSQIDWGRPPGTQHPGELTVDQKLERLAEYHRSYRGFDSSPSPFLIDIRHWQGTRRSLLAAEPAHGISRN